jgi:hypothetical protein
VFDTENAIIYIDGTANMATEQLDLTITPESKGWRLFSLRSPLYVRGPFIKPNAGVKAVPWPCAALAWSHWASSPARPPACWRWWRRAAMRRTSARRCCNR